MKLMRVFRGAVPLGLLFTLVVTAPAASATALPNPNPAQFGNDLQDTGRFDAASPLVAVRTSK